MRTLYLPACPSWSHLAGCDALTSCGLTSSINLALQVSTFDMIWLRVQNQDFIYFFHGFCMNTEVLYALYEFFEANYHLVGIRLL